MIVVAEGAENFDKILKLQMAYPDFIFPCLGYHPVQGDYNDPGNATSLSKNYFNNKIEQNFNFIKESKNIVGIGECGLDFTPKFTKNGAPDRELQKAALIEQISLAKDLKLPVNLHSRSAGKPLFSLMNDNFPNQPCLFHAFSGNVKQIPNFTKLNENAYFSVGTNRINLEPQILKKKIVHGPNYKFISSIPVDRLLLETDLPALGPNRGERNEPENLLLVVNSGKSFGFKSPSS